MLYAHSRRAARRDAAGRYVPLSEQATAPLGRRGDRRGRGAAQRRERVARARALSARGRGPVGPRRPAPPGATDWQAIASSTTRCSH